MGLLKTFLTMAIVQSVVNSDNKNAIFAAIQLIGMLVFILFITVGFLSSALVFGIEVAIVLLLMIAPGGLYAIYYL